jgi:hypothetical protein
MNQLSILALGTLLAQAEAAPAPEAVTAMTPLSWAYMLLAWGLIVALNVFCFYRLFTRGGDTPHMG